MHDYDLDEWGQNDEPPTPPEKRVIPGFGGITTTQLDKEDDEDDRPE